MRYLFSLAPALTLLAALACSPARAAETYQNCTGVINALPTTISTPGTGACART